MRILQLSDPHLLADPRGICRHVQPCRQLALCLTAALAPRSLPLPDLLLLSGDLCQDESWGGYRNLTELLSCHVVPRGIPLVLLPGNHDHPQLLRASCQGLAGIAPCVVSHGGWQLLSLDSHCAGRRSGRIAGRQLRWLEQRLEQSSDPCVVCLHHPPLSIGDPRMDRIRLERPEPLLRLLNSHPRVKAVLCGHIHQAWSGRLPGPGRIPLYGCPSSLAQFGPVQPGVQTERPGWRWLEGSSDGQLTTSVERLQHSADGEEVASAGRIAAQAN